jgi:RimJ/RimL family protein N-acetyltransferase
MTSWQTDRLELIHIEADELIELFESQSSAAIIARHNITNPYRMLENGEGPLRWRVPQVRKDLSVNLWFVRWIVLRATREIVGSTSFHGVPDERGMVEIGLGIAPERHNQGIGAEALSVMWSWATTRPEVSVLRYTVSPTNEASVALVKKFGFELVGEQMDEEDGLELIFEQSADSFRNSKWFQTDI